MSSAWSGVLEIYNTQIPIALHNAVKDESIGLKMCCPDHGTEVKQRYLCEEYDHLMLPGETGRAYRAGEQLIPIASGELAELEKPTERILKIHEYRASTEMPWQMVKATYYIEVEPGAERLFGAFAQSLTQNHWVALGHITMRTHDHLCALVPTDGSVILLLLNWQYQMLEAPSKFRTDASEAMVVAFTQVMAKSLRHRHQPLLAAMTRDRSEAALEALVEAKVTAALMPRRKSTKMRRKAVGRPVGR